MRSALPAAIESNDGQQVLVAVISSQYGRKPAAASCILSDGMPKRATAGVLPTYHHFCSAPSLHPMPRIRLNFSLAVIRASIAAAFACALAQGSAGVTRTAGDGVVDDDGRATGAPTAERQHSMSRMSWPYSLFHEIRFEIQ